MLSSTGTGGANAQALRTFARVNATICPARASRSAKGSAVTSTPRLGSAERPVRVAVVGAGPAGFFTAEFLLRSESPSFAVDVFERLPTPFGLVRAGVAPDHQKIKAVTKTFERTAKNQRFRYFGNVEIGKDLSVAELQEHYDQIVFAVGSASDRRLGIPGEELGGCHAATAFVGWYNAHPDFRDFPFDLAAERAVVVGVGNVALDISRILLRSPDELAKTDIADHALTALRASRVREVVLLARRGPAQVAFEPRELEDIAGLTGVRVNVDAAPVEDELSGSGGLDARQKRNLELMLELARAKPQSAERVLRLEFNAAPVELFGDEAGRVRAVRIERTGLVPGTDGRLRAVGTGEFHELEAGLVFRSIGYLGMPLVGAPFDQTKGVIPNLDGRVTSGAGNEILPGTYAVGWIRRGPIGVIGTNKADAQAVAERMTEDVATLPAPAPEAARDAIDTLLGRRGISVTTYADWSRIDALEVDAGRATGKVREKFATVEQMMSGLLRAAPRDVE